MDGEQMISSSNKGEYNVVLMLTTCI